MAKSNWKGIGKEGRESAGSTSKRYIAGMHFKSIAVPNGCLVHCWNLIAWNFIVAGKERERENKGGKFFAQSNNIYYVGLLQKYKQHGEVNAIWMRGERNTEERCN